MDLRTKRSPLETAGWAVLGLLLLLTLIGAVRLDRAQLPLLGDEATYAMQAASLAHDFDVGLSPPFRALTELKIKSTRS